MNLPRLVAAAAAGATVLAVVDTKPPIVVSHDAGTTWRESGRGLPAGRAIAIAVDDPDTAVYAARNRLYVTRDGGVFWNALAVELPEIDAVRLRELNSPRATIDSRAADEHAVDAVALAVGLRVERRRTVQLGALRDLDLLAERDAAVACEMDRERAGRRARRCILGDAVTGREHPRLPARPVDVREAVDAVAGRPLERDQVGPQRRDLVR